MAKRLPQASTSLAGSFTTRYSVELHSSLVQRRIRSPKLITKPSSTYIMTMILMMKMLMMMDDG